MTATRHTTPELEGPPATPHALVESPAACSPAASVAGDPTAGDPTDGALIARFLETRDEQAFARLVERHGPLVMSVCRRILRRRQDAEDVFQATFLALARNASRIRARSSLGGWLYKVAYRSSLRVRAQRALRREEPVDVATIPDQLHDLADLNEQQSLYDELLELPAAYREAIVVCCLEGCERREAAQRLSCSELVLKGRLQRGRRLLLRRLGMHGLLFTSALAAAQQSVQAAQTVVTLELVAGTTEGALAWSSGQAALSTLLANPTAYPQKGWIPKMPTPFFQGLMVGVCSMIALWGSAARYGGGSPADLAAPVPIHVAESRADEGDASFVVVAGDAGDAGKTEILANPVQKGQGDAAAKIQQALDKPAKVKCIETPLVDIVDYLMKEQKVPYAMDQAAMKDGGIDLYTPVTMDLADVPLRTALKLMLDPLGMTVVVKKDVLSFTTKEAVEAEKEKGKK